ncbi:NADP-dependent oxidoreductase [Telmatospirillum sp. J64-1]|uniref:NADP-dependent oxidoreductase n=1 Tax=Telmatospirillum sp. J64-1 TaxID=2502183 RepID=UPI00115DAE25|nr:NADP-dependent oxidoreductase [Telmatospirillum sp. J64-1]
MRAIVFDEFGGPEKLRLADIPTPMPQPNEVLIKLSCTSVNPVDWKVRKGLLNDRFPHAFPLIPGWDAAGTVAALGADVTDFVEGDKVYAYCRKPLIQWGTYAEYVTMAADMVAPMPANCDFAQAATVPLVGLTSWQCLFDAASLKGGQSVLIHAGAGGVGGYAIQFAKAAGARVITTASAANHDYVRELGADAVIDYRSENVAERVRAWAPEGVDVVFDTMGGDIQREGYTLLRKGGTLVSIITPPVPEEAEAHGVHGAYVFVEPNGRQLREIARLIETGQVKPPVYEEMPLEQAAEAQKRNETGHGRGKIVLRIS